MILLYCGGSLSLRKIFKDKAEMSQAVLEWSQRQDVSLICRVQLKDRQQPPAPSWTIGWGLEDKFKSIQQTKAYRNHAETQQLMNNSKTFCFTPECPPPYLAWPRIVYWSAHEYDCQGADTIPESAGKRCHEDDAKAPTHCRWPERNKVRFLWYFHLF